MVPKVLQNYRCNILVLAAQPAYNFFETCACCPPQRKHQQRRECRRALRSAAAATSAKQRRTHSWRCSTNSDMFLMTAAPPAMSILSARRCSSISGGASAGSPSARCPSAPASPGVAAAPVETSVCRRGSVRAPCSNRQHRRNTAVTVGGLHMVRLCVPSSRARVYPAPGV